MPLKKDSFEYVKLEEPDLIGADLKSTSSDFRNAMEEVKSQMHLHKEKHIEIREAKKLSKSILEDIKLLNEDLLKKTFEEEIGKTERKKLRKAKRHEMRIENLSFDGKEAIKHLRRNLSDLRRELGSE